MKFRSKNMTHLIPNCKINRVCFFYNPGQDTCVDKLAVPSQLPRMKIMSLSHQNRNSILKRDTSTETPVGNRVGRISTGFNVESFHQVLYQVFETVILRIVLFYYREIDVKYQFRTFGH